MFILEIRKYCITIVQITISKSRKNTETNVTERAENRPNPIVTMGLFMDADGIPLAFDIFPGNQNEQTTLKPLESTIIRDFNCCEFIFCSDAGLGSATNRRFKSLNNRSYVITHSIKKMKKEDKEIALSPKQFKKNRFK